MAPSRRLSLLHGRAVDSISGCRSRWIPGTYPVRLQEVLLQLVRCRNDPEGRGPHRHSYVARCTRRRRAWLTRQRPTPPMRPDATVEGAPNALGRRLIQDPQAGFGRKVFPNQYGDAPNDARNDAPNDAPIAPP